MQTKQLQVIFHTCSHVFLLLPRPFAPSVITIGPSNGGPAPGRMNWRWSEGAPKAALVVIQIILSQCAVHRSK